MTIDTFVTENKQKDREILSEYNLDLELFNMMGLEIIDIVPVRNIFRITTQKGMFSLKRVIYDEEEMNFIMSVIEHLKRNGFENVMDYMAKDDGSLFYEYDGEKYYLTRWVDGRELDYQNPIDLKSATHLLSKFHKASQGFDMSMVPDSRNLLGKWPQNFKDRILEMNEMKFRALLKKGRADFDRIYLEYVDMCLGDAHEALEILINSPYEELVSKAKEDNGFIHHDYAHHNLIQSFDGKLYVLDFDYCAVDIRIHDVGSLIIRNMKKTGWDIDKALYIIECYDRESPISNDELKVLIPFFLFPQDFWQISRQYYIEKKDWGDRDYLDKMNTKSQYTISRREFIEEFQKRI
ncbi:CotS family spore coat protein [Lutispora thermophila]|uniref:Spore coat protein, CotS family n=1 Tax=Lutispora thermophila DSM 19022 TaxID=1122184 RepID=A0A1M6BSU6_9FIRM|nr:CotS family spore coat protein [Lutispora thermophila]SHI51664.1 spore coat protein, CotS family [Lutispora thermophila DSM 19022]